MTGQTDGPYSWLEDRAVRKASDVALGASLLVVAAAAILDGRRIPAHALDHAHVSAAFFPTLVAGLMAAIGAVLLARGAFGGAPHMRWQAQRMLLVAALVGAVVLGIWLGSSLFLNLVLLFGPAEFVASILLALSVAIALARLSRLRAAGMVLLGLLLGIVGVDVEAGEPRLTFGVQQLDQGFERVVVAPGLLWVADSMVCLFSPALLLATYTRRIAGWRDPAVSMVIGVSMWALALLVISASCYLVFFVLGAVWDVAFLLLFGALGVACKVLGWNRLVLLLGFSFSLALEGWLRQAIVISRAHPDWVWAGPVTAILLLAAGAILAFALALSLRRALRRNAAEPASA